MKNTFFASVFILIAFTSCGGDDETMNELSCEKATKEYNEAFAVYNTEKNYTPKPGDSAEVIAKEKAEGEAALKNLEAKIKAKMAACGK